MTQTAPACPKGHEYGDIDFMDFWSRDCDNCPVWTDCRDYGPPLHRFADGLNEDKRKGTRNVRRSLSDEYKNEF